MNSTTNQSHQLSTPHDQPTNYWRVEPATGVDFEQAASTPGYPIHHVYCQGDTGRMLGLVNKKDGIFRAAWISGHQIILERHSTLREAKVCLEGKFTGAHPPAPAAF